MRAPFARFALASLLLGTEGCTAILGLDDYKPAPKDGGASSDSGGDTNPGTCTDKWNACEKCMSAKCPATYVCYVGTADCVDERTCDCACNDKACLTDCHDKSSSACKLCPGDPTCAPMQCTSECYR
jgi:hypothetical protein